MTLRDTDVEPTGSSLKNRRVVLGVTGGIAAVETVRLARALRREGADLLATAQQALEYLKAVDPVVLDVRELSSVMDWLIVASGTSSRHVKSLADNVIMKARQQGVRPLGVEGERVGEWVLVDFGDVVVHVMQPAARSFYDLERLWSVQSAPPESS